ncbi:MAG: acyltransferase family protein [Clostridia bacterium]
MDKKVLNEVFLLRSIACLCIVLLHSITRVYTDESGIISYWKLFLSYGTPSFVFISELILAYAYPVTTPQGFLLKRIWFILIPYLVFGILEAAIDTARPMLEGNWLVFFKTTAFYLLLGEFPGYFVLVIFQFYLLHLFCQKYVFHRFKPSMLLLSAFLINTLYLAFFNFTDPITTPVGAYIWERGYRLPFFGWIFYFMLAYYCGTRLRTLYSTLHRFRWRLTGTVLVTAGMLVINTYFDVISVISSKRVDMVLFCSAFVLWLLYVASRLKHISNVLIKISQYSFGIYLVHPLVFTVLYFGLRQFPWLRDNPVGVVLLFSVGLPLSMLAVYVVNRIPWGAFVIGRIGIGREGSSFRIGKNVMR